MFLLASLASDFQQTGIIAYCCEPNHGQGSLGTTASALSSAVCR